MRGLSGAMIVKAAAVSLQSNYILLILSVMRIVCPVCKSKDTHGFLFYGGIKLI